MDPRKGDARIYIITGLFFSCIISGGVFLCLYIILPETQSSGWFPIAGMVLVSIPWAFWLFTSLYRCFKFYGTSPPQFDSSSRFSKGGGGSCEPTTTVRTANPSASDSPDVQSPSGGAERRVQFGPVVVLGTQGEGHIGEGKERGNEHEANHEVSNCSTESEMPLRLSI